MGYICLYLPYMLSTLSPQGTTSSPLLEVRLGGPDGAIVGAFEPTSTGSWGTYVTVEFAIDLEGHDLSGIQNVTLRGFGSRGIMNLDWWEPVRYEANLETHLEVGTEAAECWESIVARRGEVEILVTSAEGRGTWLGHHVLPSSRIDPTTGKIIIEGLTPGMIFSDPDRPPTVENEPDFAAEVAVLSRPVVFESVQDGPSAGGFNNLHGGHIIIYHTPHVAQRLEGAEIRGFGQQGELGRYVSHRLRILSFLVLLASSFYYDVSSSLLGFIHCLLLFSSTARLSLPQPHSRSSLADPLSHVW